MKNWKPIFSVAVFLGMQLVGGVILVILNLICGKEDVGDISPEMMAGITAATGIASVLVIGYTMRSIDFKEAFHTRNWQNRRNWAASLLALGGAAAGIFAVNLLNEQFDLPDLMKEEFLDMSQSLMGMMSIAVIAPIAEELIFRESITGYMLRHGRSPLAAILTSALLFGIAHLNPAQVPFAALMGVILGVLYWRTRNVWLCSLVHILNNAQAVWLLATMGEEASEYRMSDDIGSTTTVWTTICVASLLCMALLWRFCQTYQPTEKKPKYQA